MTDFAIHSTLTMDDMTYISDILKEIVVSYDKMDYNKKVNLINIIGKLETLSADFNREKSS